MRTHNTSTFMIKKIERKIPTMPPDLALWLTLISSNYPCIEHNLMAQKVFEPLKFYCILYQLKMKQYLAHVRGLIITSYWSTLLYL